MKPSQLTVAALLIIALAVVSAGIWLYKHNAPKTFLTEEDPPPPAPENEEVVEFSGCITLDVSKDSDRFLGCVQDKFDKENIPYMKNQGDGSTSRLRQALKNLASDSCKNTSKAMVIGHGQPGFIHVDGGDYYVNDRVSMIADVQNGGKNPQPWNESEWTGFVKSKLHSRFNKIVLLGCDTGSPDNHELLPTMAAQSAASVSAPKGKVWCDPDPHHRRVIIDKRIGWSTVSSEGVAEQQGQNKSGDFETNLEIGKIVEPSPKLQSLLSAPDLEVSLCLKSNPAHKFDKDLPCKPLAIEQRHALVEAIFKFRKPFQTSYISGADRTGSIELSSQSLNLSASVDILNDDLVRDVDTETYYRVSDLINSSWKTLIR